jgi:F-type H+-transporting ATPase subunit alpha
MPVEKQIIQIYAGTQRDKNGVGWIRNVEVSEVSRWMNELTQFIDLRYPEINAIIREKKDLTDDIRQKLDAALEEFRDIYKPAEKAAGA